MMDSPAFLLAQLLDHAAPEDRHAITAWLLERSAAQHPAPDDLSTDLRIFTRRRVRDMEKSVAERLARSVLPAGEDSQLVTVRLPQSQHAQLRDWCAEQGFSMASVIRGLIERFLEAEATWNSAETAVGGEEQ
jgi:hypothetical protein